MTSRNIACLALLAACRALCQGIELLSGLGLLGDHFGAPGLNASFDYVVVGGGTAGIAVATRLAEDCTTSVALIEAGGFYEFDDGNFTQIPGYNGYFGGTYPTIRNGLIDWQQMTVPMSGFGGRSIYYSAGKTFGGGSARNFLVYNRATRNSHHMWAEAVGDDSYEFDAFLPYHERAAHLTRPNNELRAPNASYSPPLEPWGANDGPVQVSYPNSANAIDSWVAQGLNELGITPAADFVNGSLMGAQYCGTFIDAKSQTRSTSEASYMRQALLRESNLLFYKSTLAKRLVFNETRAVGVQVETAGSLYTLTAAKEVVLSAGAFRSPQLLMVSGLGPRTTLERFKIPVLQDLPGVGQDMQDQPVFGPAYAVNVVTHSLLGNSPRFRELQIDAFNSNQTGILTNNGNDFIGFEKFPASFRANFSNSTRSSLEALPPDWPELEWVISDTYSGYFQDLATGSPVDGKNYFTPVMGLLAPFSRGNVTINSSDTTVNPIVNPNLLGDPRDQEQAIAAYRRARQLPQTAAMKPVVIGDEAFPGLNVTLDEDILRVIQASASTIWHASCTCKMGTADDPRAVVDSKARVFGFQNLRVVDASALPFLPPIHPTSTIYAFAEKIADDMLNDGRTY